MLLNERINFGIDVFKTLAQKQLSKFTRAVSITAILILVLISAGDIHSHFCFDGQEPAVSLHFENLNGHPDHSEDESAHNDFEAELSVNTLLIKFSDFGQLLIANTVSDTFVQVQFKQAIGPITESAPIPEQPSAVLPPLRAPPVLA